MLLPVFLMKCNKREHVYRSLEHKEPFAFAVVMKGIFRFASGFGLFERFACCGCSASVTMARDTFLIQTEKNTVMKLGILIQCFRPCEVSNHITGDKPFAHQISIYAIHRRTRLG